ncbi:5765_t:CDS:2, partial [Cetraspora pellucida]
ALRSLKWPISVNELKKNGYLIEDNANNLKTIKKESIQENDLEIDESIEEKKRIRICPSSLCQCEEKLGIIENCEQCKNNTNCGAECAIICDDCLHRVLK